MILSTVTAITACLLTQSLASYIYLKNADKLTILNIVILFIGTLYKFVDMQTFERYCFRYIANFVMMTILIACYMTIAKALEAQKLMEVAQMWKIVQHAKDESKNQKELQSILLNLAEAIILVDTDEKIQFKN